MGKKKSTNFYGHTPSTSVGNLTPHRCRIEIKTMCLNPLLFGRFICATLFSAMFIYLTIN